MSETTKSAEKTKNDYVFEAILKRFPDTKRWEFDGSIYKLEDFQEEAMESYANSRAIEALKEAAEVAKVQREEILNWGTIPSKKEFSSEPYFTIGTDVMYYVDKQSILNLIEKYKH